MDYLYHYTNIESLALILKNHTIRFSSLDQMDDKQENASGDLANVGSFCYVSSWTSEIEESIPMWNMYASFDSGVRIKLRKNPFKIYTYSNAELRNVSNHINIVGVDGEKQRVSIYQPIEEVFNSHFVSAQLVKGAELYKVEYTHDRRLLYPELLQFGDKKTQIGAGELGKYKNKYWEFQKEWRYRWLFFPINVSPNTDEREIIKLMNDMIMGTAIQPFKYYDNKISDEAYSEMEITLSPAISPGNEELILNTIKRYNPTATIKLSALKGLI